MTKHMSKADRIAGEKAWCILRMSPGRTVDVARSLARSGIETWTPIRVFKREKPGRCSMIDGKKPTVEIEAPILPTFVFAAEAHLHQLATIVAQPVSPHPDFSIFRYGDRYPMVTDREIIGLRAAERDAAILLEEMRDSEDREERKRARAEAARNDRERRKALRAERRHFGVGTEVTVNDMPALSGMSGIVQSSDGRSALVAFGGSLLLKIETWQLVEDYVERTHAAAG